jgi:hypothetical protein
MMRLWLWGRGDKARTVTTPRATLTLILLREATTRLLTLTTLGVAPPSSLLADASCSEYESNGQASYSCPSGPFYGVRP